MHGLSARQFLGVICLRALLVAVGAAPGVFHPQEVPRLEKRLGCRCVPDEWEGVLLSVDREFDLGNRRTNALETALRIHYDLNNGRFAMIDLNNGKKIIDDYKLGQKFLIGDHGCVFLNAQKASMHPMCLPENSEMVGQYLLGTSMPVALWQVVNPHNMTMRTTVLQENCIPISEEIYMGSKVYSSLTNSLYLDVSLGIRDAAVFEAPHDCAPANESDDYEEEETNVKKRSVQSYTEALRERMSRF